MSGRRRPDEPRPPSRRRPPPPLPSAAAAAPEALTEVPEGLVAVRAPMVGTFYLRPSPDQPAFVTVGGTVQADDTVCLVEVMKMFNTVKAEVAGTVERILVENGQAGAARPDRDADQAREGGLSMNARPLSTPVAKRDIRRVFVANRGEIAVRVIRACRSLGIEAVVGVSEADTETLAARMADEVVVLGPPLAAESYLRADKIVEAALQHRLRRGAPRLRLPVRALVLRARLRRGRAGVRRPLRRRRSTRWATRSRPWAWPRRPACRACRARAR